MALVSEIKKARIAYSGKALDDGTMPVRDLAPALLAFSELVENAYKAIGGERQIKVLLNQDSLNKGSFDITFLLNLDFAEQLKMFVSGAQANGLSDLMTVLGWGTTLTAISGGIFALVKKIGARKIKKIDSKENRVEMMLDDGETILTTPNTLKVFMNVDCRLSIEKIVDPLKQSGIDSFSLRDPNRPDDKAPLVDINKMEVDIFKAPPAEEEADMDQKTSEMEMLARIITVNFELGKWRLSDGNNTFWASIEDDDFLKQVERRDLAFRKGDTLRIKYYIHQTIRNGKLATEYVVTHVIELREAPRQIKLNF